MAQVTNVKSIDCILLDPIYPLILTRIRKRNSYKDCSNQQLNADQICGGARASFRMHP